MNQNVLNQVFFTSASSKELTYGEILDNVKKYCTTHHSDKLTAEENPEEARKLLREFILQYIHSITILP